MDSLTLVVLSGDSSANIEPPKGGTEMELHQIMLAVAVVTLGLMAGFFFAFSTLVMPGLKALSARDYVRSFQSIDRILQRDAPKEVNTQPIFGVVFIGAIVGPLAAALTGWSSTSGTGRLLILGAAAVYLLGTLVPTITVNVPLNNRIQTYDADALTDSEAEGARGEFEDRWNRWNLVRTISSCLAFALVVAVFTLG